MAPETTMVQVRSAVLAAGLLWWAPAALAYDVPAPAAIPATGTVQVAFPPWELVTLQPSRAIEAGTSDVLASTRASRSASVTSFLASARAIAWR